MTAHDDCVAGLVLAEPPEPVNRLRRINHAAVQQAAYDLRRAVTHGQ
jgi:hypothetical protein